MRRTSADPTAWLAFSASGVGAVASVGNVGATGVEIRGATMASDLAFVDVVGKWLDLGLVEVVFSVPAPRAVRLSIRTHAGEPLGEIESAVTPRAKGSLRGLLERRRERRGRVEFGRTPRQDKNAK